MKSKYIHDTQTTKDQLLNLGWVDKGDVLVRYSNPRIGWKPSGGTLIIGYHEYKDKVHTIEELDKALCGISGYNRLR